MKVFSFKKNNIVQTMAYSASLTEYEISVHDEAILI